MKILLLQDFLVHSYLKISDQLKKISNVGNFVNAPICPLRNSTVICVTGSILKFFALVWFG